MQKFEVERLIGLGATLVNDLVVSAPVLAARPGGAVDQLPYDNGVPGVPMGLGDHVHEDPVQGHLATLRRPPGHLPDRVQRR